MDTDDKKDRFFHGLAPLLQEKLYTVNYQTFRALMNAAIAMEGFQRDSQAEWKSKRWLRGLPAILILRRYRLSDRGPISHQAGLRQP